MSRLRSLKSSRIQLVPFDENYHFDEYFQLRNDTRLINLWNHKRHLVTRFQLEDELKMEMRDSTHLMLSIVSIKTDEVIGFTYTYGYQPDYGVLWLTTVMKWEYVGKGYGVHVNVMTIPFLFENFNLRKIYCDVYSHNVLSEKILRRAGFHEEGRLKSHVPNDYEYSDLVTYALYRDSLKSILLMREKLL